MHRNHYQDSDETEEREEREREELVKTVILWRLSEMRLNCSRKLLDIISSTCGTGAGFTAEFTFFSYSLSLSLSSFWCIRKSFMACTELQ